MCGKQNTIRTLRKRTGLRQKDIAAALGVDQSAVSQWETGRTSPDRDKIPLLAHILNTNVQTLLPDLVPDEYGGASASCEEPGAEFVSNDKSVDTKPVELPENVVLMDNGLVYAKAPAMVPFVTLGRVHAGGFDDEGLVGQSVEVPSWVLEQHPNAQAVVVEGDCMSRVAPDGSVVIFDPDLEPTNGRVAIVETEDHRAVMRRWFKGGKTLMLCADSYSDWDDIVITGSQPIRVIGTVVYVIGPSDRL